MTTLVEINGIDEGGKVGELIWFVRVGTRIDSEIQVLLRNLEHFDQLIVGKSDLIGREKKNLMKYVRDVIDDPNFDVSIFKMRVQTQIMVLRKYFEFLFDDMFMARKILIDEMLPKTSDEEDESTEENSETPEEESPSPIWQVTESLKRFSNYPFMFESAIKAYGMMNITAKLDRISQLFRTPVGEKVKKLLVTQIDGGYPFAFWWKNLLESTKFMNFRKRNTYISGVSQGDCYYPALSTAGTLATILNRYPAQTSFFPSNELVYDLKLPVNETFYVNHTASLLRPTFIDRLIFVGKFEHEVRYSLPYCLHRQDRKKTYEPYQIEISAESFFHRYGFGNPENTLVIIGKLMSEQHKRDVWFIKQKGFTYKHLPEMKESYDAFCTDIEDEIDFLHKEKRVKLGGKFEQMKKKIFSELK